MCACDHVHPIRRRYVVPLRLCKLMVVVVVVGTMTTGIGFVPASIVSASPATRIATLTVRPTATAATASPAANSASPGGAGDDIGQPTPFPLSHLAARWTGDETAVVEVRWATASGWQPW